MTTNIGIVGAGPCGLACARELVRLGHENWTLFERSHIAGGHAGSVVDDHGFTWDLGGHVVFSHFGEFDSVLEETMGAETYEHERSSYVRFADSWVPYPFQNNLHHLPRGIAYECLLGLIEASGGRAEMSFAEWMGATFGAGITRHFMEPYNRKVWATPAERMSATWIAERVSVPDYRRALENFVHERDDLGWGPNSTFRFPMQGGTGEIYRRLAARLDGGIRYGRELVQVDPDPLRLIFENGAEESCDALVSTMPLDRLVGCLEGCPPNVVEAADALEHNGVWVVGAGYEVPLQDERSWLYFPDGGTPFYRVTNFAKYSPAHVPGADVGRYSAFLTETAYSRHRPVRPDRLAERVVEGLTAVGLVAPGARIASLHSIDVEYAYPVPTLGRDEALATIQPWLMERGIYSRGRFGAWRYEIGNMDHAVKMGMDVARLLVQGTPEELWRA